MSGPSPVRVSLLSARRADSWLAASLLVITRLVFAWNRTAPNLSPDELANLGVAHFLGGHDWTMLHASVWRPGLPTLLAPLGLFIEEPEVLFRVGLGVNALIGGFTVFALQPVVRVLTGLGHRTALGLSTTLLLTPWSLVGSSHLWAEPAVTLCVLGTLCAMCELLGSPSAAAGGRALLWSSAGYLAHGRLLALVIIVVVVAVALVWRASDRAGAVGLLCCGIVAIALSNAYTAWIVERVWESTDSTNSVRGALDRLDSPLPVMQSVVGQTWYLMCATGGLVAVGVVVLVTRLHDASRRRDAIATLLVVGPLFATSVVFMADRPRVDQHVYGRYNDSVFYPMIAVGAVALYRAGAERRATWLLKATLGVAVVLLATTVAVGEWHGHELATGAPVLEMTAGLIFAVRGSGVSVGSAALAGLALWALVMLAGLVRSRSRQVFTIALPIAISSAIVVQAAAVFWPRANSWGDASAVSVLSEGPLASEHTVGVSLMPDEFGPAVPVVEQVSRILVYQMYLADFEFVLEGPDAALDHSYSFAVVNDAIYRATDAEVVWIDPQGNIALWRR